jgi:hypothetical protein
LNASIIRRASTEGCLKKFETCPIWLTTDNPISGMSRWLSGFPQRCAIASVYPAAVAMPPSCGQTIPLLWRMDRPIARARCDASIP